ncbi:TraC family protein, partial [Candidatus Saccharibacteria bacterium]|nr:TraC family protein [Candidatus Saccharibacteria bacterium]
MSVFKKSNKPRSSRAQICIKSVQGNILELPQNQYRSILEVSSINFELMSETEQDALTDTYQSFLHSLSNDIQIIVRVRELDMEKYIEEFKARLHNRDKAIYQKQAKQYLSFIRGLVSDNKVLSRRFYVVVSPIEAVDSHESAKEQLLLQVDSINKGLGKLGMQTRQLEGLELLEL